MTAIQDFIADPAGFLDANCLQSQWDGNFARTRPALIFQPAAMGATRRRDGANVPLYRVVPISGTQALGMAGGPNVDYLYAYFCPYRPNETHGITLGTLSNFMFTTTMDGCTLGVGSPAVDGSCRVAHSNVTGVGALNYATQAGILAVSSLDVAVDPVAYRGDPGAPIPNSVTTIGVRNRATGAWRFMYQTWTVPNFGGRPTVVGVTEL